MSKAAALDADEAVSAGSVFRTVFDEQRRMRIAIQVDGDARLNQLLALTPFIIRVLRFELRNQVRCSTSVLIVRFTAALFRLALAFALALARGAVLALRTLVSSVRDQGMQRRCLLYTSPSPRDQRGSRMPSSA